MNTEKQPCTNLASLIATYLDLIGPCTRLLALHSLPIGWYVTLNKVLADHRRLLNCDGNSPKLHVAIINADMGELQLGLRPHWNDSLPPETPLATNVRSRQDLEPDEAEQIERLFATAPETLTRIHLRYAASALVHKAREAVRHICEECGAPGERQKDLRKPRVLCPHHYVIALAAQRETREGGNAANWGSRESYPDDDDDLGGLFHHRLPEQVEHPEADTQPQEGEQGKSE